LLLDRRRPELHSDPRTSDRRTSDRRTSDRRTSDRRTSDRRTSDRRTSDRRMTTDLAPEDLPPGSLTVAVTGPTGEIGVPFVRALEATPEIGRVVAMARRPFEPTDYGWTKTVYRQGDILDRADVEDLVAGVDVVVHLAFIVVEASAASRDINVEGSRNVFRATADAGVPRLVYTSSVAAYGYDGGDGPLTEDRPSRGSERHAYSAQKAEVERVLADELAGSPTDAWIFRPCIVAGPDSPALLDQMPYHQLAHALPEALRRLPIGRLGIRPVLPDHGVPFQLVHGDDVASALVAAVLGRGGPGIYNLAAPGEVHASDIARELGWYSVPIPRAAVDVTARVLRQVKPFATQAGWLEALRTPMMMDCSRAERELGWQPAHDAEATLHEMVAAYHR
jgi:UDP-glucose 4-epimerase